MKKNKEQREAEILAAIQNEETVTIASVQEKFGIGFPLAGEIYEQEMARRNARTELHLHTVMSAFGGLDDALSFFEAASERGINAIAVTDLGSVQSYPTAIYASRKYGIKALFGAEFFVDGQTEGDAHRVVVLAKNNDGIKRIYDLVTVSQTTSVKENIPFLPFDELTRAREDILIGFVACDKEIAIMLDNDFDEDVEKLFSSFDYIEIAPPEVCSTLFEDDSMEYCEAFLKRVISVATDSPVPVIASDDACYIAKQDAFQAGAVDHSRTLDCLRRKSIKEPLIKGRYFRSTQEMLDSLSFLGIDKAKEIVIDMPNKISASIKEMTPFENNGDLIPLFPDADKQIAEICRERLERMFASGCPFKYWSRLRNELKAIKSTHSASAFLTCYLIAKKAKEDGRMMSSRGMAGNSFVAYLLGITEINPLKPYYYCPKCDTWEGHVHEFHHGIASSLDAPAMRCLECGERLSASGEDLPMDLLFGTEGDRVPDIDMEFSSDYLGTIHEYLSGLFGEENLARAGTIETLGRKSSALRAQDYLKGKEIEPGSDAFESAVGACMVPKRLMGQHPCGYVVLPKGHRWNEFTPLEYPFGSAELGHRITHCPWSDVFLSGRLYKFDLLGHGALDLLERLAAETGVDANAVRLDDQRLIDVLCGRSQETTFEMIPGCKGAMAREAVAVSKPSTFSDLIKVKGMMHGTGVWYYYKGKLASGEVSISDEMVTNRDDLFLSLLSHKVERGMAYAIAERVRKGRGLSDEMEGTMRDVGFSDCYVGACQSVGYLFPKAHIVGFLRRELRMAFFKLNYPEQYRRVFDELFN